MSHMYTNVTNVTKVTNHHLQIHRDTLRRMLWERGPKTSQDSVMEQAIQDNSCFLRDSDVGYGWLWRIEMR